MSLSYVSFGKRLYYLYRPYFGLKGKALGRTLSAGAFLLSNIILSIISSFITTSMTAMVGVLEQPGLTYAAFFSSLSTALIYITFHMGVSFVKNYFINKLHHSLSSAVDKGVVKRWLNKNGFYGMRFLPKKYAKTDLNPAQIISNDNADLMNNLMLLGDDFIGRICYFSVGLIALFLLSEPLSLTFFAVTFTLPGSMALGALAYAFCYSFISNRVGAPLRDLEIKDRKERGRFYRRAHDIDTQAEPIALLRGASREYSALKKTIQRNKNVKSKATKIRLMLNSVMQVHMEISTFLVPILLSLPNIIAEKMKVSSLFGILPFFHSVVQFLCWKNDNYDSLATSEVSLTRMERFDALIRAWEEQVKKITKNQIDRKPNGPSGKIRLKNIHILNAKGKPMLKDVTFTLEKGKATLLRAPSGAGKTTLFRAIANLWPYMRKGGSLIFPGKSLKVHFIPQDGLVFHKGLTLLETIVYPKSKVSAETVTEIKKLMGEFKFKKKTIQNLHKKMDIKKILSGGERQRLAIIAAIINNPDLLLMDESTSAIDRLTKEKVERIIKKKLPKAAIIYIDHNPTHRTLLREKPKPLTFVKDKKDKFAFCNKEITLNPALPVTRRKIAV